MEGVLFVLIGLLIIIKYFTIIMDSKPMPKSTSKKRTYDMLAAELAGAFSDKSSFLEYMKYNL